MFERKLLKPETRDKSCCSKSRISKKIENSLVSIKQNMNGFDKDDDDCKTALLSKALEITRECPEQGLGLPYLQLECLWFLQAKAKSSLTMRN